MEELNSLIAKAKSMKGRIWINMLVEYDLNGNAVILKSFCSPAQDSKIKGLLKEKKFKEKFVMENTVKESSLF